MQEQIYFSRNSYSNYIVVAEGVLVSFYCFLLKELIQFIKLITKKYQKKNLKTPLKFSKSVKSFSSLNQEP